MSATATPPPPVFFVGGAPRSGTTVTHALICTAARMCVYHPEASYVMPLLSAYTTGMTNWDAHTHAFFAEREHFRLHMEGILEATLAHLRRALGGPEILCLKDPLLTPYFPRLAALLGDRARFVTVIRHPHDVVRSRQEVAAREGNPFTIDTARAVARQYAQSYRHLDNPALAAQRMHFRYEDILDPGVLERLRAFTGCADIAPDRIWADPRGAAPEPDPEPASASASGPPAPAPAGDGDPWYSPKYHGAIDLQSRLGPLDPAFRVPVDEICGPLMTRFDYRSPRDRTRD